MVFELVAAVAFTGMCVWEVFDGRRYRKKLERELDAFKLAPAQPQDDLDEDDKVLCLLEASAAISPLAARLLQEGSKLKCLPAPTVKPSWVHNPDDHTPCEEQWGLFVKDMERESTEAAKLTVLEYWLIDGVNFTFAEKNTIFSMFETDEGRLRARALFIVKKEKKSKKKG